jgi:Na+/melibiose symporter-like transporter
MENKMTSQPETPLKTKVNRLLIASLAMIILGVFLYILGTIIERNSAQYLGLAGFIFILIGPLLTLFRFKLLKSAALSGRIGPPTRNLAIASYAIGDILAFVFAVIGTRIFYDDGWVVVLILLVIAAILAVHAEMIRRTLLVAIRVQNTPPPAREKRITGQPSGSEQQPLKTPLPITTCPNCKQRVLPKPDGTCPSCQYQIG